MGTRDWDAIETYRSKRTSRRRDPREDPTAPSMERLVNAASLIGR
jgi:hypothetical protein